MGRIESTRMFGQNKKVCIKFQRRNIRRVYEKFKAQISQYCTTFWTHYLSKFRVIWCLYLFILFTSSTHPFTKWNVAFCFWQKEKKWQCAHFTPLPFHRSHIKWSRVHRGIEKMRNEFYYVKRKTISYRSLYTTIFISTYIKYRYRRHTYWCSVCNVCTHTHTYYTYFWSYIISQQ